MGTVVVPPSEGYCIESQYVGEMFWVILTAKDILVSIN